MVLQRFRVVQALHIHSQGPSAKKDHSDLPCDESTPCVCPRANNACMWRSGLGKTATCDTLHVSEIADILHVSAFCARSDT